MRRLRWLGAGVSCLLMLSGCATQLAPAYDASIAAELSTANSDIQALFVSVGDGVDGSTFATRKPAYDHVIAELQATLIEIRARPIPNPQALEAADNALQKAHIGTLTIDPDFSDYPSARSIKDLAGVIKQMETTDAQSRLQREAVPGLEQPAIILLTQAITYENFLKR